MNVVVRSLRVRCMFECEYELKLTLSLDTAFQWQFAFNQAYRAPVALLCLLCCTFIYQQAYAGFMSM